MDGASTARVQEEEHDTYIADDDISYLIFSAYYYDSFPDLVIYILKCNY